MSRVYSAKEKVIMTAEANRMVKPQLLLYEDLVILSKVFSPVVKELLQVKG